MTGPEAFVLIEGDDAAQRLVLSWPRVPGIINKHRRYLEWARLAGVDVNEVYRCADTLFENELLYQDGTVDAQLVQLVQASLMRRLGARRDRPRRPRPDDTPPTSG